MNARTHLRAITIGAPLMILLAALVLAPLQASAAPATPNTKLTGMNSNFGPALAPWGSSLMLAYTATNGTLYITSSRDGVNFSSPFSLTDSSIGAPAICLFNSHLYYFWTGTDRQINVAYYVSGNHVLQGKLQLPGETSDHGPGCATDQSGNLWVSWSGVSNDAINLLSTTNGGSWNVGGIYTFRNNVSEDGAALSVDPAGRLVVAYPSYDRNTLEYLAQVSIFNSNTPQSLASCVGPIGSINARPNVTTDGTYLYFAYADETHVTHIDRYSQSCALVGQLTFSGATTDKSLALTQWGCCVYFAWTGRDAAHTINVDIY